MKKKFFCIYDHRDSSVHISGTRKGTKTYWFQIASQGEGESGFLTNSNLNQKKFI